MKTRRRIYKGGDARQGAQGCVIIPSLVLSADGRRDMKYVTKIFFMEKEFNEEKTQNDLILSTIDPGGTFTSASYTQTPVDFTKMTPEESRICSGLRGKDVTKLKFLNYKYLGISIDDIATKPISPADSKKIITALSGLLPKMIEMNRKGYYHNDVHAGNIMYNKADEHAYLIDFGMMSSTPTSPFEILAKSSTSRNSTIMNDIRDLTGFLDVTRLFTKTVAYQDAFPKVYSDILDKFSNSISPLLGVLAREETVENAQNVLLNFFVQFASSYQALKGGRQRRRKTLRRRAH